MGGKRGPSDPSNRETRAQMGQQTLEIIKAQGYDHPEAGHVDLSADIAGMLAGSRYFNATEPLEVPAGSRGRYQTQTSVSDRSTLEACRLLYVPGGPVPAALNFASARHPGGGFLGGAQAQEESLARSSALYASQTSDRCKVFYEAHSKRGPESWIYSDAAIFTPSCPVFRADDGTLLAQPYLASFITSAAPNLSAMLEGCRKQDPGNANGMEAQVQAAQDALVVRGRRVLQVAAVCGCTRLVLGAWGAGVFGNDPEFVAKAWRQLLSGVEFQGVFEVVEFAALDKAQVFHSVFGTS